MKEQLNAFVVYHNTCFRRTRQVIHLLKLATSNKNNNNYYYYQYDDGNYLLISEIYDTRQLRARGLFDHFYIYFCLFHLVLMVQFQPHFD